MAYPVNLSILGQDVEVVWKCPRGRHVIVEDSEVVVVLLMQVKILSQLLCDFFYLSSFETESLNLGGKAPIIIAV